MTNAQNRNIPVAFDDLVTLVSAAYWARTLAEDAGETNLAHNVDEAFSSLPQEVFIENEKWLLELHEKNKRGTIS